MENEEPKMPSQPFPTEAPPSPAPKRTGCSRLTWGIFGGCLLSCVLLVAFMACFVMGSVSLVKRLIVSASSETTATSEHYAYERGFEGEGGKGVLRLELNGVILGASPSKWHMPADCDAAVRKQIEAAIEDESIQAILLLVDSPGGDVTASDLLWHALDRFKAAQAGRKVVVQGGNLVASGAYYLSMQADWIRVLPTSLVGSIGVIMPGFNASSLAGKLGIADNSITSGASKDLGNPLKPVNPEHNAILQSVVDGMYRRFVMLVVQGRHLPEDQVRRVADGRVFLPEEALALKLIDEIGYEDTIEAKVAELLGCAEEELTIYTPAQHSNDWISILSELPEAVGRGIAAPLMEQKPSKAQYIWQGNR